MHTPTPSGPRPQTFIFLSGDAQPLAPSAIDRRFYVITSPVEVAGEIEYRSWMHVLQQAAAAHVDQGCSVSCREATSADLEAAEKLIAYKLACGLYEAYRGAK